MEVFVSPAAQQDIILATQWYEDQRAGLGQSFAHQLRAALLSAAAQPTRCSPVTDVLRKIKLDVFPYVAVFEVRGRQLRVIAILGAGQDWDAILQNRFQSRGSS